MTAAPASAAEVLALLTNQTGRVTSFGFNFGQLVGADSDENCLLIRKNQNGCAPVAIFISSSTTGAGAGTLALARNFRSLGFTSVRYVLSSNDIQVLVEPWAHSKTGVPRTIDSTHLQLTNGDGADLAAATLGTLYRTYTGTGFGNGPFSYQPWGNQ